VVPPDVEGHGQLICECSRCHTSLRIAAPWYFFGARPHVIPAWVLEEAQRRGGNDQPGSARGRLLEALARLSASANEQQEYLAAIEADEWADELVEEFIDTLQLGRAACGIGDRGHESVIAIFQQVELMKGRDGIWSPSALSSAPEWEQMRRLARIAADDVRRGW
jgi:hypothetical protein